MKKYILHCCLALCLCGVSTLIYAGDAKITHIAITHTDTSARVVLSITGAMQQHTFLLKNPDRVVLDLSNTRLATDSKQLHPANGIIQNMRVGYPKPATLRLVFDLSSAAQAKSFFELNNKKLILEISYQNKNSAKNITRAAVISEIPHSKSIVVVIDAGHGGKDTGARGPSGVNEKDVVLAIAKQLAVLINREPNMHAVLTRQGDYFVPLRDRLRLARKGKADLFVAIHADSYFNSLATGASVYTLSQHGATTEAARWLAKRENDSLGGVDLGELGDQSYLLRSVLIDLAQTATIRDSLSLGSSMLGSLHTVTRLHYSRVEQAPFMVLKSPDIPSVLVETGFISNASEEEKLRDTQYQHRLAVALLSGVQRYLKKHSAVGV